jgi:hypothetical protein
MPSSVECRLKAERKLLEATRDKLHSRRLNDAAQAWLLLGTKTAELERSVLGARSKRAAA